MKFKFLTSAFLFTLLSAVCYTQTVDVEKEKKGDEFILKGLSFYKKNNIDSALIYFKKSSEKYKNANSFDSYVSALNDLTFIYNQDKRFAEHTEFVFKAFNESNKYLEQDNEIRIRAFQQLITYYYSIGDFNKAIRISEEALLLNNKNKASKIEIAKTYFNLGNSYRFYGDSEQALSYLKKALKIQLDSIPAHPKIAITYQSIGRVFKLNGALDSTIYYFKKAESLLKSVQPDNRLFNKKINNYLLLAELWNEKGNNQEANTYINKASQFPIKEYYQVQLQETLGKIYVTQRNYKEAIRSFKKGQEIAEQSKKRNTPPLKARRLIELANAYDLSNDFNNALSTYQEALKVLSPDFDSDDFRENPADNKIFDQQDALTILNGKAEVLNKLYLTNNDPNYLKATYDAYHAAADLIRDIRQGILTIESKKILSEKTIPIYEGAIQSALDLFRLTEDLQYKESALSLAESNKALLLLESINEQSAKGFAGIPDSLLEQEKDLKLNLAFLQNELLNNKAKGGAIKNIEDQIFDLNQKLDRLSSDFEKNYPRYFELKYQNEPIDLKTIQQELAKSNNALLEYFVGAETIYLFVVTADAFEIQRIDNPQLVYDAIRQLRPILNNPPGTNPQAEFAQFTAAAHSLYALLLEQALEQIPKSISGLTIIPDDQLNYIPFSILLTEVADKNQPSYTMADLAYLMEQYPINYHYSATLLHKSQQRNKQTYQYDFIGFAPSFKEANVMASRACTADELYSLQCSGEEVTSISKLLSGVSHSGAQATKSIFEKEAAAYRIIHLATHACVDENNSNLNKIFLTDDYLSSFDLYNMELHSELAVLSACNTGSGELVKGEGVMNMARGFINAGCSSTLMSMWSVDDCATSDIMLRFYEGLKKGLKKDEALRAAKLSYLESVSKTKMHPYYWAAFVPFGDMAVMEIGEGMGWWFYLAPVGLLVLLFMFFRRRK